MVIFLSLPNPIQFNVCTEISVITRRKVVKSKKKKPVVYNIYAYGRYIHLCIR